MKEYRIVDAENQQAAERAMNEMAALGWEVVSTCYWQKWRTCPMITFVREKQ